MKKKNEGNYCHFLSCCSNQEAVRDQCKTPKVRIFFLSAPTTVCTCNIDSI